MRMSGDESVVTTVKDKDIGKDFLATKLNLWSVVKSNNNRKNI
jgi:hypothetical protein